MFISTGHNICLCNLCTSISWGFMYSYVNFACFISIYTHDVNFTYVFYSVFYNALARESATFVVLRHSCTFLHCVYLHYWSYTSRRLMFFVVKTTWNKACSILFYSILPPSKVVAKLQSNSERHLAEIFQKATVAGFTLWFQLENTTGPFY